MKRKSIFLLLALAGLLLAGCAPLRSVSRLRVDYTAIKYVVPTSFHSLRGVMTVRLDNPSDEFFFDDIQGVIRHDKTIVATLSGERVFIRGHATQSCDIPCTIRLAQGVSFLDLLSMASDGSYKALKVDLSATVYAGKQHKKMKIKGIEIEEFLTK